MRRHGVVALLAVALVSAAGAAEWNPVRVEPVAIGPQANRIIVGFRTTENNALVTTVASRMRAQGFKVVQAQTSAQDVAALALRSGIAMAFSRQLTPSMHVLFLPKTLYGADVLAALAKLRADPAVAFAAVDQRRYALQAVTPNDTLFPPTGTAVCTSCTPVQTYSNGQWIMRTPPSPATSTDNDLAATDAVSAWAITTGSSGVVIADVDTGVRFEHPDLLRAGFGGRLLPGYDFVNEDSSPNSGAPLGTYLIANDGDGWDPDPSDPGDWLTAADEQNTLFPASQCGPPADSSWHGTRVAGILGALTDNGAGVAGMTWGPWILPVRALGKCGGYDSDIISGIEWAAGMPVTGVPNNPYPANIVNLSLGGSGSCPSTYESALQSVTGLGVLVVASAGNGGGVQGSTAPVDAPANCSVLVPGVIAVAGLRNVGTKVGYSSSGPEVDVSAPAGNCVQLSGACLRTIDTTTNLGTQGPGLSGYTDQINTNLGTSFSAPIVAGIAALMRSANANLTPAELAARLETSASPFPPNTAGLLVCPNSDPTTGECSCPSTGQCGTGMVDALAAVDSALKPIAAVALPATVAAGSNAVFDASGSAASCNRTIASYAWSASGGVTLASAANLAQVTAVPGSTAGTLNLVVTDSSGASDTATIDVPSNGAPTAPGVPPSAGSAASACPAPLTVAPAPPTVGESFTPMSVAENVRSTLTVTFTNSNPFALTQAAVSLALPAKLTISSSPQTTTSCGGAQISAHYTTTSATLGNAVIPANGSCAIIIPVQSAVAGAYMSTIAPDALTTGPAGANSASASATLTVTVPMSGGGALGWPELLAGAALVYANGRRARRRAAGRAKNRMF